MAKYSRSSLSMKESLREISAQRAEKFLNTFYFQYGHRSIADLAHIAFAIERLSLLAAIAVADEQRWDGQERSTRYQDFSHPDYYMPEFGTNDLSGNDESARKQYVPTIEFLFAEYQELSRAMLDHLRAQVPCPATMKPEQYERTLRARAFDIARYLLPLATNTSLGQIVNARTLETQISRLLSSPMAELREVGGKLKDAARSAAYDANARRKHDLYEDIEDWDPIWAKEMRDFLVSEVRPAPTLVKYAEANPYFAESRKELESAARELMAGAPVMTVPAVDLLDDDPIEIELAATLLYEHCQYPYRQIREHVEALGARQRAEIVCLGTKHRGKHDELLRAFYSGERFRFDILMDIGAYRDMHRHRRCIQIGQDFTTAHGYDVPSDVNLAGWGERYQKAMTVAREAVLKVDGAEPASAAYIIPLAYRKRTLFKMDFAEVVYISELRTAPAGHFSYRKVAWEMFEAVAGRHPELAGLFRVHDPNEPSDLLQR
jgi:thymidylate synthase ThyX